MTVFKTVFLAVFVAVVDRVPVPLAFFPHGYQLWRSNQQSRPRYMFDSPFWPSPQEQTCSPFSRYDQCFCSQCKPGTHISLLQKSWEKSTKQIDILATGFLPQHNHFQERGFLCGGWVGDSGKTGWTSLGIQNAHAASATIIRLFVSC